MTERDILLRRQHQQANYQKGCAPVALTPRERDVLYWAAHGKTDREIGTMLGISVNTVSNHMHNVIRKLVVTNRTHAVALALYCGLVTF